MKRKTIAVTAIVVAAAVVVTIFAVRHRSSGGPVPAVAIFNLVSHPILDQSVAGIKAELADRGYSDDNIRFVEVNANGQMELLNAFAQELLASNPDVIVPVSTPVTQAVVQVAGQEQAIVYSTVTNPDDVGMADNPANMTGVSDAVNYEANIDLIQELFPQASSIGIIYNAGERNSQFGVDRVREIVEGRNLTLALVTVSTSGEVADAAQSLSEVVDVFYIGSDNTVVSALASVLSVARERRLPVIASDVGSVEKGALAAVSVNYERVGREAGRLIARILDTGIAPGEIEPVFVRGDGLVLNTEAAEALNFEFPGAVRERAERVLP